MMSFENCVVLVGLSQGNVEEIYRSNTRLLNVELPPAAAGETAAPVLAV